MNPYDVAIAVGIVAEAWLLALVTLRGHRPWLQATYAAATLAFVVNGAAYLGTAAGLLSADWQGAVLWTMVLAHPLAAILVLSLIHGETIPRRRSAVLLLLALVPAVVLLTPVQGQTPLTAYEPGALGAFLIVCLGIALAEPVYERITSTLFAQDAFWLSLGVVALVMGGPVYTYEFEALGLTQAAGSNVAAPIALAAFALVFFHADPYPISGRNRAHRGPLADTALRGKTIVFDEARPRYARQAARDAAKQGRPTLVLARDAPSDSSISDGLAAGYLESTPHAALQTLGAASTFLARAPGGLVVLSGLGDLATLSGWPRAREAVARLRPVVRDAGGTLVLSDSTLLASEKEDLRALNPAWWSLPDPADEMEALLAQSFGTGAGRLIDAFCSSRALRRQDLMPEDAGGLADFLARALAELSGSVADGAATQGLALQADTAAAALRAFASRGPEDLARGGWPSQQNGESDRELLVTAAGYWKGKELEELFSAADGLEAREPLYQRARNVFVEQLGIAGEGVLRSELSKLGKRPEELRPEDVARLADRAAVDLGAMADVVDVPQERDRIRGQVESIRRRLEAIAEERA